jgi:hypothetical protein
MGCPRWILTLSPKRLFPAQVIESMSAGQPVVGLLVVLAPPLDVGLVGGGGHEPNSPSAHAASPCR